MQNAKCKVQSTKYVGAVSAACSQMISSHAKHHNQARALHLRCINWHLLLIFIVSSDCIFYCSGSSCRDRMKNRRIMASYFQQTQASPLLGSVRNVTSFSAPTQPEKTSHKIMRAQATGVRNKEIKVICMCFVPSRQHHLAFDSIGAAEWPAYCRRLLRFKQVSFYLGKLTNKTRIRGWHSYKRRNSIQFASPAFISTVVALQTLGLKSTTPLTPGYDMKFLCRCFCRTIHD